MLELNGWFFVQLVNFLLLIFLMNVILFRPMLRLFKEREESTAGALERAKIMNQEKEEVIKNIDEKMLEARNNARNIFEGLSNEGLEIQKGNLDSAQHEAIEINRKSKEELEAAVEKARTGLKAEVESITQKIVDKLTG